MIPGTDTWICSNCGSAVPKVDWYEHREAHINEYKPKAS